MQVKMSVRRFDPDVDVPESRFQEYDLELTEASTVLDGLIHIREEIDGTLALRCSCRSAICGSCAMRINGHACLACNTRVTDALPADGGPIVVEPAGNMDVIKDLVVDMKLFWDKIRAVEPWLQPQGPAVIFSHFGIARRLFGIAKPRTSRLDTLRKLLATPARIILRVVLLVI